MSRRQSRRRRRHSKRLQTKIMAEIPDHACFHFRGDGPEQKLEITNDNGAVRIFFDGEEWFRRKHLKNELLVSFERICAFVNLMFTSGMDTDLASELMFKLGITSELLEEVRKVPMPEEATDA